MPDEEIRMKLNESQISLREELMGRLSIEGFGLRKREISVMTRMSADIVEILDALVELEIFKSRSEAVAAFVEKVISARRSLFDEIRAQAAEIRQKRETAKMLAIRAIQATQHEE
ncbi:MAG: hypothetical protein ACP6IT_05825 [Candidatus Thorarchaeota archaeon]